MKHSKETKKYKGKIVGYETSWKEIPLGNIDMHGENNIKFISAQQAKSTYNFRNIKENLQKTIAPYCLIRSANLNNFNQNIFTS
jgi:hypothetical protein